MRPGFAQELMPLSVYSTASVHDHHTIILQLIYGSVLVQLWRRNLGS